jgi:hypothetical protein
MNPVKKIATAMSLVGDKIRGNESVLLADTRDVGMLMSADMIPAASKMLQAVARNLRVADMT